MAETTRPAVRPVVAVLPERHGVASPETLFDLIAIAMRGHQFIRTQYARTDLQRNMLAEHLLRSDFTHILMLDADHRYQPDIVERLTRWVKPMEDGRRKKEEGRGKKEEGELIPSNGHGPQSFVRLSGPAGETDERLVVAGLAFRRAEPFDPNVYIVNREEHALYQPVEWGKGLMRVDIAGTAAMLISRKVFERLPKPWFAMDYSRAAEGKWPGEDIWFCERLGEAGIDIWVDTTVICPHLREGWVDQGSYESYARMAADKAEAMRQSFGQLGAAAQGAVLTEADLAG